MRENSEDFIWNAKLTRSVTDILYNQLPISLTGVLVNVGLLTFFLRNQVPHRFLIAWLSVNVAILGFRFLLCAAYRKQWIKRIDYRGWLTAFLITIGTTGVTFGSIGFLGIGYPSLPYKIFIYFVLGGMAAASVGAYSVKPVAAYLNSFPLFIPVTMRFFFMEQQVYLSMAVMGIAFYIMMIFTLHRTSRTSLLSFQLAEENRQLNSKLKKTNLSLRRNVNQLQALYDLSPYAIFIESPDGEILDCNKMAEDLTGYSKAELRRKGVKAIIPTHLVPDIDELLTNELTHDGFLESYNQRKSGELFPVEITKKEISLGDNEVILVVLRDITERRKAQDRIRILSWAVEQSPASVIITDTEGSIQYVNPKFTTTTGYTLEEVRGRNPRILNSGRHSKEYFGKLWKTITAGREWHGELCNITKDGREYWESASISPILDVNNTIINYVAVKEDITEKKKQQQHMEHLALYDELTNLPNRRLLTEHLLNSFSHADRTETTVAILYLDLNNFKPINDQHGHDYGDEVLKVIAERIRAASRKSDTIARIGGDEFIVVAKDIGDSTMVSHLAERLIALIEKPMVIHEATIQVGLSIGISLYPYHGNNIEELLHMADMAMYAAKSSMSDQFVFAS
jgi:diguanylate cyclase (GGDEF)-like protein/PAS domain S-box-containing protein